MIIKRIIELSSFSCFIICVKLLEYPCTSGAMNKIFTFFINTSSFSGWGGGERREEQGYFGKCVLVLALKFLGGLKKEGFTKSSWFRAGLWNSAHSSWDSEGACLNKSAQLSTELGPIMGPKLWTVSNSGLVFVLLRFLGNDPTFRMLDDWYLVFRLKNEANYGENYILNMINT